MDAYVDDLFFSRGNTNPGPVRVVPKVPIGTVYDGGFTPVGAATHQEAIGEFPIDGDTLYSRNDSASKVNHQVEFDLSPAPPSAGDLVYAVQVMIVPRHVGSSVTLHAGTKVGTVEALAPVTVTSGYVARRIVRTTNPATGLPWAPADVDSFHGVIKDADTSAREFRITSAWWDVIYGMTAGATPTPSPTPDPTPSPSPAPSPTPEPSPSPTPEPDPTPTPEPSPSPEPDPSPTPEPEPSPTPNPSPDPTPEPSPTPESSPGASTSYTCTQVIGFSQGAEWYLDSGGVFESLVDDAAWEIKWEGGGAIGKWADPKYYAWDNPPESPCVTLSNNPDRVVITISGNENTDWAFWIRQFIVTVRAKYSNLRMILLQPVVGGPNHALCWFLNSSGTWDDVRASYNHPAIDAAIGQVLLDGDPGVQAGASPEVSACTETEERDAGVRDPADQYRDATGHLTPAARPDVAQRIGEYYAPPSVFSRILDGIVTVLRAIGEAVVRLWEDVVERFTGQ